MANIQSATAENRQGKRKKKERKKPQRQNIIACPEGAHNLMFLAAYQWPSGPLLLILNEMKINETF